MPQELGKDIFSATMKASRELTRFHPRPDCGLKYLEPYLDMDAIDGLKKTTSDNILCLYLVTVADCYREKGNVDIAAQWYKRASSFRIMGSADIYAEMVINHKLSDYYEHALMCLQESRKEWMARPFYERIYYWLVSLTSYLEHPWDIPKLISLHLRSTSFEKKLQALTLENS
jgi:tetratricopeptide (TPR) repeat protein